MCCPGLFGGRLQVHQSINLLYRMGSGLLLPPLCVAEVGVSLFDGKHFTQVLIAVFKFCCYASRPRSLSDFLHLSAVIRARYIM